MGPGKVFLALASVLAAIAAAVLLTRPSETPAIENGAVAPPDTRLTNAEALARFEELKELRDRAYHSRDLTLIPQIYSSGSPARGDVEDELRRLAADNVFDRTRFRTLRSTVLANAPSRIVILQVARVKPKVVSESGKDVTTSKFVEERDVKWFLQPQDGVWLVWRTLIIDAERIR